MSYQAENNTGNQQENETIFWQILEMIYQWKKLVFWITGFCLVVSILFAFLLPKEYKAIATVVPSQKNTLMSMFGAVGSSLGKLAKDLSPLIGGKGAIGGEGYSYMSILNSRTAMERVVNKFNLIEEYDISDSSMEKAVKELRTNVDFELDEFGSIQVKAHAYDPVTAADMANYFVEILSDLNAKLSTEDARNVRTIIEKRYLQNVRDLGLAEDSLKIFQEKYGLFSPPEQAKATITANAQLESQLWINEIKLGILESQMDETSQEVINLKMQLSEIKKKLRDINTSKSVSGGKNRSVMIPIEDVPERTREYLDLFRNVELQVRLMEFLYPMYEQAKLQEAKDAPPVLILDKAIPPEKKARPIRSLIILSGLFLGLFISFILSLFIKRGLEFHASSHSIKTLYYRFASRMAVKLRIKQPNK